MWGECGGDASRCPQLPKPHPNGAADPNQRFLKFWDGEEPLNPLGVRSPPSLSAGVSPCPGWAAEIPGMLKFPWFRACGGVPKPSGAALSWRIPSSTPKLVLNPQRGRKGSPGMTSPGWFGTRGSPVPTPAGNTDPPPAFREYLGSCPLVQGNAARRRLGE